MHGRLRWLDVDCTVVVDGMTVRPGDVIHADVNGAISIPVAALPGLAEGAAEVRQGEEERHAGWRKPGFTLDEYEAQLKRRG